MNNNWAAVEDELRDKLWLRTHPIGYKRFENPDELDSVPVLIRLNHYHSVCQMIAQSRKLGPQSGTKTPTLAITIAPESTGSSRCLQV